MKNKFKNQKVLILGLGLNQGGLGAAKFFARSGAEVRVTDLKTKVELRPSLEELVEFKNIEYILGEHREEDIDWAEIIIRNPALKPGNKYREYAQNSGKRVELDVGIFLDFVKPHQIIGVTGSKGKTTTSSLIYYALKDKYPNTILAGNIGKSVLDGVEEIDQGTLVILELSSFQLEGFEEHKISPHIGVITNIFPEHLNYYEKYEDYIAAKRILAKYQTEKDFLYLPKDDQVTNSTEFLQDIRAKKIQFSKKDLPENFKPTLIGEHNLLNYAVALDIAKGLGVEKEDALKAMNQFSGAEFRLQLVKTVGEGVKIYNDSTATNPTAAIQSLKALPNSIFITGGMNKGLDFQDLAENIDKLATKVYFIDGDATDEIKKHMKDKKKMMSTYNNLEQVLKDIKPTLKKGDKIIFSPGATSFNFFQNEFDRGHKFNQAVEKVFK